MHLTSFHRSDDSNVDMAIIAYLLMAIGVLLSVVYGIILLIKAFQASAMWGLAYIFIPFAALVFIVTHWDEAGKPFLMSLLSIPFLIAGALLLPGLPSDAAPSPPAMAQPASQEVAKPTIQETDQPPPEPVATAVETFAESEATAVTPSVQFSQGGDSDLNAAIAAYLDSLYVGAVKSAGRNSKVVLNNKVYRPNSMVSSEFNLRVLEIHPQEIIFIDDAGTQYIKYF